MADSTKLNLLNTLLAIGCTLSFALAGWAVKTTTDQAALNADHSARILAIEESRFTRADAAQMQLAIEHDLAEPPRWVDEKFDALERQMAEVVRELRELRQQR